jgi:hypothetical protein
MFTRYTDHGWQGLPATLIYFGGFPNLGQTGYSKPPGAFQVGNKSRD